VAVGREVPGAVVAGPLVVGPLVVGALVPGPPVVDVGWVVEVDEVVVVEMMFPVVVVC
jgi:hypothetical protein